MLIRLTGAHGNQFSAPTHRCDTCIKKKKEKSWNVFLDVFFPASLVPEKLVAVSTGLTDNTGVILCKFSTCLPVYDLPCSLNTVMNVSLQEVNRTNNTHCSVQHLWQKLISTQSHSSVYCRVTSSLLPRLVVVLRTTDTAIPNS